MGKARPEVVPEDVRPSCTVQMSEHWGLTDLYSFRRTRI